VIPNKEKKFVIFFTTQRYIPLTKHSFSRYPCHTELQENDANKAIEDAKCIQEIILSKL